MTSSQGNSDLSDDGSFADADLVEGSEDEKANQSEEPVDLRTLLTQDQVQAFKDIFNDLDIQKNGNIPTKLMGTVIRGLGYNPTKAAIKEYMSKADPERKGVMDFQGFLLPLAEIIETVPETLEDILLAFKALDESDLGYINTSQLYEYLTTLGEYLEDFEIDLLIKMADPKGHGKVMYEEFLEKQIGVSKKKSKSGIKERKKTK